MAISNGLVVIKAVLGRPKYLLSLVGIWFVLLWIFIYFTSLDLFVYLFRQAPLAIGDKLIFMLNTFTNVFKNIGDPMAFSIVVFSFLAALNLILLIHLVRNRQKTRTSKGSVAAVASLVGSHCVACGGSLLAPVVTALAGSGAYFSAARANTGLVISLLINLVGTILIARSTLHIARQTAVLMPNLQASRAEK